MDQTSPGDATATLARWQAEEAQVRQHLRTDVTARAESIAHLSGLELLNSAMRGERAFAPIGDTLDFLPIHFAHGHAVLQGRPLARHYNPMGTVHGGWFAALLDSAVGCAVHSTLTAGKAYTTVELKINLVRALTDRVPLVRAEGRTIHVGRSMATADGRLLGHDGTLYAHASTTCFIFDLPKSP